MTDTTLLDITSAAAILLSERVGFRARACCGLANALAVSPVRFAALSRTIPRWMRLVEMAEKLTKEQHFWTLCKVLFEDVPGEIVAYLLSANTFRVQERRTMVSER